MALKLRPKPGGFFLNICPQSPVRGSVLSGAAGWERCPPCPSERRLCSVAGSSRGPSPLTMGAQDTLPVAAAFTETVNAYFKGADPSK